MDICDHCSIGCDSRRCHDGPVVLPIDEYDSQSGEEADDDGDAAAGEHDSGSNDAAEPGSYVGGSGCIKENGDVDGDCASEASAAPGNDQLGSRDVSVQALVAGKSRRMKSWHKFDAIGIERARVFKDTYLIPLQLIPPDMDAKQALELGQGICRCLPFHIFCPDCDENVCQGISQFERWVDFCLRIDERSGMLWVCCQLARNGCIPLK